MVAALRRQSEAINHACVDMLCTLMQPMHQHYELRQEQLNKTSLLSSEAFLEHLLEMGSQHVVRWQPFIHAYAQAVIMTGACTAVGDGRASGLLVARLPYVRFVRALLGDDAWRQVRHAAQHGGE